MNKQRISKIALAFVLTCTFLSHAIYAADREWIFPKDHNSRLVIFIHGFTGDYKDTWDIFPQQLSKDERLSDFDFLLWGYPSNLFKKNPSITRVGEHLLSELQLLDMKYSDVVLIGHSMGGLVIRASIVSALSAGKANNLGRIRHVILFGVPNEGIDKADYVPSFINSQVSDMRTTSEFIIDLRNEWIQRVFGPAKEDDYHKRIPTKTVVGLEDHFVPEDSVKSFFPGYLVTDGDHVSMVKPSTVDHLSYKIVQTTLLSISASQRTHDIDRLKRVLSDIHQTLIRKREFMFPAIETFLNNPSEANWHLVQRVAKENLLQIKQGVENSLEYDSNMAIDNFLREIALTEKHIGTSFDTFKGARKQWAGRAHVFRNILKRNVPATTEEVQEWQIRLDNHYKMLERELHRIITELST